MLKYLKGRIFKMFGSSMLNTVHKRYIVLTRTTKTDSQVTKTYIGKVIKKLNIENKSLFGELLETRPQKRKREARKMPSSMPPISSSVEKGILPEAWWYSQTSPASSLIRNANVRSNVNMSTDGNLEQPLKTSEEQLDRNVKTQKEKSYSLWSRERNIKCGTFSIQKLKIQSDHPENVSEIVDRKPPILELPNVIVRNIPTFPLMNENKDFEWVLSNQNIVNISSKCENVNEKRDYLSYPSVSKILNATMSEQSCAALKKWRQKMISELGEEGFLIYYRDLLDRGSQFHTAIHSYLSGTSEADLKLDSQIQGCWHSLTDVIEDIRNVKVLESHVVHSGLLYRGVIDCVAQYKGKPVLIEWKKSDKQKPEIEHTYDAPLQLSAYIGAMNYDVNYDFQAKSGLVVVAYSDGSRANTFNMTMTDCKKYWNLWLLRLQKYWLQQNTVEPQSKLKDMFERERKYL